MIDRTAPIGRKQTFNPVANGSNPRRGLDGESERRSVQPAAGGIMRIGILGSGLMGAKLGTIFARAGHEVVFTYARSENKLKRLARKAGKPLQLVFAARVGEHHLVPCTGENRAELGAHQTRSQNSDAHDSSRGWLY